MTSWSVVRSSSAMRATSTRGARLDRRQRVGGDEAARGLGPGHRELHPEHLLEPRLVRPERAHLGQRVAPDHAAAPSGRGSTRPRRCRAGAACHPTGSVGGRAPRRRGRAARSAPRADDREDAPTARVCQPSAARPTFPMWNTSAADSRAASMPAIASPRCGAVRVAVRAARTMPTAAPGRTGSASPSAARPRSRPRGRGQQQRPERHRRGAAASTWVSGSPNRALHSSSTRSVGGQHQPA